MNRHIARNPFEGESRYAAGWWAPQDGEYLPMVGARCLFEIRGGVFLSGRPVMDGFMAYGYRADQEAIVLPLWGARLSTAVIRRWQYAGGPAFWDGSLKPLT